MTIVSSNNKNDKNKSRVRSTASSFFKQDRFQVAAAIAVVVYKARTNVAQEAPFTALSLGMDIIALSVMFFMHREGMHLCTTSLLIFAVVNSLKFVSVSNHNCLYALVALLATLLIGLSTRNIILSVLVLIPVTLTSFEIMPSPLAAAYLLDSVVGLPLLFMTLPNQFGEKRQVNGLACHALVFVVLGRVFLAGHYLEIGVYRKFQGPWDVPLMFRGKDCFAASARSVGFLFHLVQAGFFVKFLLYYVPAFCSSSTFQMPSVGCRLEMFDHQKPKQDSQSPANYPATEKSTTALIRQVP